MYIYYTCIYDNNDDNTNAGEVLSWAYLFLLRIAARLGAGTGIH